MNDEKKLTERSLEIFRELVDAYIETHEAVGSRLLSKRSQFSLSSATIRNVMADLEDSGLLYAPHTSAGRIPTEAGFQVFVKGLLESSDFNNVEEIAAFKALEEHSQEGLKALLEQATALLSELSSYAGIVFTPRHNPLLKCIEFVTLNPHQLLVILISQSGHIENRIIPSKKELSAEQLASLSRYLSECMEGKTLDEALKAIQKEMSLQKNRFSAFATNMVQKSLEALQEKDDDAHTTLILKGHSNLLDHVDQIEELEKIRHLFDAIETKKTMISLLDSTSKAEGVQVFIGAENQYFDVSGCSLIASPYKSPDNKIIGALGVIGPMNMEYRRVIPLVNYTSKIVNQLLKDRV